MSPYLPGFFIPTILLILGIAGKKLAAEGLRNWKWTDLNFGVDFALLGFATCGVNFCDLYKTDVKLNPASFATADEYAKAHAPIRDEQFRTSISLFVSFVAFLFVATEPHRRAQAQEEWTFWQKLRTVVTENIYGYSSMVLYLLWVKGV